MPFIPSPTNVCSLWKVAVLKSVTEAYQQFLKIHIAFYCLSDRSEQLFLHLHTRFCYYHLGQHPAYNLQSYYCWTIHYILHRIKNIPESTEFTSFYTPSKIILTDRNLIDHVDPSTYKNIGEISACCFPYSQWAIVF